MTRFFAVALLASTASAAVLDFRQESSSSVAQIFQTSPQIFAGPTKTGSAAFLAETNPVPFGSMSYVPNTPLQTSLPIQGIQPGQNIFQLVGQLSPYAPSPGFGINEHRLPPGSNITHVNLLHRHGARYPTGDSSVSAFGSKLYNITKNGTASWSDELSFLNDWSYRMGAEILVPRGRQELFDSGVLFAYNYGHLYNTSSKIIARTTTEDRMLKSAENFMAGLFGLSWTDNATLEVIIEQPGFNNSLAGYFQCNNSNNYYSTGGNNASLIWEKIYLADASQRLSAMSGGYNWTIADVYNAQTLCPYETVAFGYSAFCDLFTYEEWQGFEYTIDLQFYGNDGFGSPTGRGVGIGYVEEIYARLSNHLYNLPAGATQANTTLDESPTTFPLNQSLYLDFSHDTNIYSIITALGLKQFNQSLSTTGPPANQQAIVSHMTPFGARLVWELITAPAPVKAQRPTSTNASMADYYDSGNTTMYVHQLLNQRTLPLGASYPECGQRDDGWCEMDTYLTILGGLLDQAQYAEACFGDYPVPTYGETTDGAPPPSNGTGQRVKRELARELGGLSLAVGGGGGARV